MKFIYPEILWALLIVAIPILVHLFNFRKFKKVKFSSVTFLKEIKQETQNKSKLKHLLILLSRILAIAAIVFAFAQPYFPLDNKNVSTGDRVVSIYIDNSFSMEANSENGRLLDLAKNKALEIIDFYRQTDKFQLLTNDFEGRHQRFVNKEEIGELIQEIELSPSSKKVSEVISRQKDLLMSSDLQNKTVYLLSDLQSSTHDFESLENDSMVKVRIVPTTGNDIANVYIDSVWFESPIRQLNQSEKLNIRLKNTSQQDLYNIPLKLNINGEQKSLGGFDIAPGEQTDTSLFFTNNNSGLKAATLSITDYPIVFDDTYYFSYNVAEKINVLEIRGSEITGKHFEKIYNDDDYFVFNTQNEKSVDYSSMLENSLVILNQVEDISSGLSNELGKFIENGASVLIIPATELDMNSYNSLLANCEINTIESKREYSNKVSEINLQHPLYNGVFESLPQNIDLPKVESYYKTSSNIRSEEVTLLGLQNGDSFLSLFNHGSGKVYFSSVSLNEEESNFSRHAIFVATMVRIAEMSQSQSQLSYTIGKDDMVMLRNENSSSEDIYHLVNHEEQMDFMPGHRQVQGNTEIYMHNQISKAGNYLLSSTSDTIQYISFNNPRLESNMASIDLGSLQSTLDEYGLGNYKLINSNLDVLKKSVEELDEGKKLWRTFVILSLILLAIEILLIKLWK